MKQIFEEKDLKGKTIESTLTSGEDFWMKFTDGSFVVLDIQDNGAGFGYSDNNIVVSEWQKDNTDRELITLGIITKEEYTNATTEQELRYEKQRAKEQELLLKAQEEAELSLYEKLKSKFGGQRTRD